MASSDFFHHSHTLDGILNILHVQKSLKTPSPAGHRMSHPPETKDAPGGGFRAGGIFFFAGVGMSPLHPLGSPPARMQPPPECGMNGAIQRDGRELKAADKSPRAAGKTCCRQVWGAGRELLAVGGPGLRRSFLFRWLGACVRDAWGAHGRGMLRVSTGEGCSGRPRTEDARGAHRRGTSAGEGCLGCPHVEDARGHPRVEVALG